MPLTYLCVMLPRRPRRAARGPRAGAPLVVAVLTPALLATACSTSLRSTDAPASPKASASASASAGNARLDLSRLPVPRADFCPALSTRDVSTALDGSVTRTSHYGDGDEFEVRPGYRDVSHEFGCVFQGADGSAAKVWVFARPVSRGEARTLVRRERRQAGCSFPRSLRFGRPGLTSVCRVPGSKPHARDLRARLEGLFRDSWLACEVSRPAERGRRSDLLRRAEQWCVDAVTAASAVSPRP